MRCLPLLFACLLLCVPGLVRAQADPDPTRFADDIESFARWDRKNSPPAHAVLFVGSSSIVFWPTAERFPEYEVINRGFGGSHISDVLHYFDRVVAPYAPRMIVFYAGDNDMAGGKSASRVLADYRMFVERVEALHPETPVVYIPIKPSLARWEMWDDMKQANALIATFSDQYPHLYYADTATPMLGDDGTPRPSLFVDDGLHLSPEGYDLWTSVLRPFLNMSDP